MNITAEHIGHEANRTGFSGFLLSRLFRQQTKSTERMRFIAALFVLPPILLGIERTRADALAAEPPRLVRIGALTDSWGATPGVTGLRDGLVELGYRENTDFVIGVRFTQGDVAALPAAAKDLLKRGVDIFFTTNPASAKAAQKATNHVPIVFTEAGDPIGLGLIQSFARPGGNITGVTNLDLKLDSKRLEVFKEMIPGLKRVLVIYNPSETFSIAQVHVYREAARLLDITLIDKPVRSQDEARAALADIRKVEAHGILAPRSLSFNVPGFVLEATSRHRIPTMFNSQWYVERGGLASYSADHYESGRHAARLVEKILKGAKPSQIPVEVNSDIEFVVNLKVANTLGLKLAPEVLYRANRLIRE